MASLNKVNLIGNIDGDPDIRYLPNGIPTVTINMATTHKWKDKHSGQVKDHTEWHRVVFFDGLANVVHEYIKKGSSIYVEGKLRTTKWIDKQGVERYSTEIIARDLQMLGKRPSTTESNTVFIAPSEVEEIDHDKSF